jgi:hypothetical protein
MAITALQFVVFSVYLLFVYKRFEILESISHSTYEWNEPYLFTLMCWSLALLNLFQGMQGWGVLTSVGLMLAGITVDWMNKHNTIHFIGAVTAILSAFVGVFVMYGIWIPFAIFVVVATLTYINKVNWLWWVEVQAFMLILISYLLR